MLWTNGEQRLPPGGRHEASCVAVLELHGETAVMRVVLEAPTAPFNRPALQVAMPVGSDSATVTAVGGGEDLATITYLAVETSDVWTTQPVQVYGATFALFTTSQYGRAADVLDLGYARMSITGDPIPDDLALTVLPADAFHWQ